MTTSGGEAVGARSRGPARAGRLVLSGVVFTLWTATWYLARIQEYAPHASIWYPPAGVAFAAFTVLGLRAVPAVAAAVLVVTLWPGYARATPHPLGTLLFAGGLSALAHVAAYGLGAAALRRWARPDHVPRAVTAFLLIAPVSAALATAGGVFALWLAGLLRPGEAQGIHLPWFIGDFVGVVALAPAFGSLLAWGAHAAGIPVQELLGGVRRITPARTSLRPLATRLVLCLLPLACSALLLALGRREIAISFLVFFAVVPLMWIVHTEGAQRTFASVAILSMAIAGAGAFLPPGDHATAYQFAMIVLAGSAYFGLAVPSLYLDNEHLRRLATTDGLTGALTRAHFLETARRESERARRFGTPYSVVVLDVDRFKFLNDSLGHPFGDAVLAEVVARLRRALRDGDVVGRIGGDELAVLLPMTVARDAAETAERLAQALRTAPVRQGGEEAHVTASFGVAGGDAREGLDGALARADRALYEAKRDGRDRVTVAPPAAAA